MTLKQCIRWTLIYFVFNQIITLFELVRYGHLIINGMDMATIIPFLLYTYTQTNTKKEKTKPIKQ